MKEIKEDDDVESLEIESNKVTILNKYLKKKLKLYKKYIILTKDTVTKCLSDKNNSSFNLFNSYVNEIQKDFDNLKEEYEKKYYPKHQSLYDECLSDITMGKPVLKQIRAEEFALDYLKDEKDCIIKLLKKSVKSSKEFHLFREPRRDSLIDTKKGNKEIEITTSELQQNMLYECKKCNKYTHKIKKYNYQKKEIKKNIELLKKYIENEKSNNKIDVKSINSNTNNENSKNEEKQDKDKLFPNKFTFEMGKVDLKQSVNLNFINPSFGRKKKKNEEEEENKSDEEHRAGSGEKYKSRKSGVIALKKSFRTGNKNKRRKNKIISEFKKVEDLFNISSEEGEKEKIIHDELHSDDETVFEDKIVQPKELKSTYLKNVKKEIPTLNLNQIEYNKLKIIKEADKYSLQRRNNKSQNIDKNIKEVKKKIEKINEKVTLNQQKEKIMKDYIEKIKEKLQILKPIKSNTSAYKVKTDFIKKSLFGGDLIEEEKYDDENGIGNKSSDYENEEKEDSDKEAQNIFNYNNEMKRSVFVGRLGNKKKKMKKMKQSVHDGIFKNRLRDKLRERERAKSK